MIDYVLAKNTPGPGVCRLGALQGIKDTFELLRGISRAEDFPSDAYFVMDPNFVEDLLLEDFLWNSNGVLVVSERARELLAAHVEEELEFLPVKIINHKGREEGAPYFLANVLNYQDCIDESESKVRVNKINPARFSSIHKLVVDEEKLEGAPQLFRLKKYPPLALFRRTLAQTVSDKGLTGLLFVETDEWKGK